MKNNNIGDFKEGNLNDTKFLLNDSMSEFNISSIKKKLDNTQLLLNDKTSILTESPMKSELNETNQIIYQNNVRRNSSDEEEIIRQQNILLNDKSSRLDNLDIFSLSYTDNNFSKPNNNSNLNYDNNNYSNLNNSNNKINQYKNEILNENENTFKEEKSFENNNLINNQSINNSPEFRKTKTISFLFPEFIYFNKIYPTETICKEYNIPIQLKNIQLKLLIELEESQLVSYYINEDEKILETNLTFPHFTAIYHEKESKIEIKVFCPLIKDSGIIYSILQIYNDEVLIKESFLKAKIEIPKLCCLRLNKNSFIKKSPLITINLNINYDFQEFEIPFKNYSSKDMELEYKIIDNPNSEIIIKNGKMYQILFDIEPEKYILKKYSSNKLYFKINIVTKTTNLKDNLNTEYEIRKILKFKIKNTSIEYIFYLKILFFSF